MPSLSEMRYFEDPYGLEHTRYQEEREQYARDRQGQPIGEARASVPNKYGKRIADAAYGIREDFNHYYVKDWVPGLGGMKLGELLGQTPEELERWAYGNSPYVEARPLNRAAIPTVDFKSGRRDPVFDVGFSALDVVSGAGATAKLANIGIDAAKPIVKKYGPEMAADIARATEQFMPNQAGIPQIANRFTPGGMRNPEGRTSAGGPLYAVKPEGGNWLRDPKELTDKYVTRPHFQDSYDEWLSAHPEQLDDNSISEKAWDTALARRAEIEEKLNPKDREIVQRYRDADDQHQLAESGEYPELDSDVTWQAKSDAENEIIREIPMSIEDRVAILFDPYQGDDLGDADEFYRRIAADKIAKENGIPTLTDFMSTKNVATNWGSTVVPKYMEKKFATPSDPLRIAADEGRYQSKYAPDPAGTESYARELRESNQAEFTKLGQEPPPIEGLAKTPEGSAYERKSDWTVRPHKLSDLLKGNNENFDKSKFPWLKDSTPGDTTFYDFADSGFVSDTLKELNREARSLVDEGKMTADNFKRWNVEQVAVEATNRRLAKEKLEGATRAKIDEWAQERYKTLPVDKELSDGGKIVRFNQENSAGNPELLKRDLSLQTCILEHCVGSAGRNADNTKYLSMVSPATGIKTPKSSRSGLGYDYFRAILEGESDIVSVFDNKGLPHGTIKFDVSEVGSPDNPTQYEIEQIRGFDNEEIPKKYHKDLVDYLNENHYQFDNVNELDNIGASEADSEAMWFSIKETLAGDSEEKMSRLLKKASDKWNRDQRRQGRDYLTTPKTILEEIVNNDFLNGETRFVLDSEADAIYKKAFEDFIKR